MAKEQFTISESQRIVKLFDKASNQTGLSRGQVFEDFLTMSRCALAGGTMEDEYLATVAKGYASGSTGNRVVDTIAQAFGELVNAMEDSGQDVLGDIFTGAITYGEHGQFFTPDSVCNLMGALTVPSDRTPEPRSICDPACGSGRMLLSVGRLQPHWELTGQDVDHRATQMTAINLGLNGLGGWAVWQNTLTLQCHRVYKIGFNLAGGVIREIPVEQSPFHYQAAVQTVETPHSFSTIADEEIDTNSKAASSAVTDDKPNDSSPSQLDLF